LSGCYPFGFRPGDDGELVRQEAEQEAIEKIIALRVEGRPLRAIAAIITSKGHPISHEGVAGILKAAGT
jgi:putative DNA-invertase from lambdoid prophage Rac